MYLEKEEPTVSWIRTSFQKIAQETDGTFTEEYTGDITLETPNDGEFTLYIDPYDKENSYIMLTRPYLN